MNDPGRQWEGSHKRFRKRFEIEIELLGYDESGPDGVPPNPWWARTRYATRGGEVTITSVRRKTAWLAIADVIYAMHAHLSDKPYAAVREIAVPVNGRIQIHRHGDGRYIPSPGVDYSKQAGKGKLAMENDSTFRVALTSEEARRIRSLLAPIGDHVGISIDAKLQVGLANLEHKERRKALGLPWAAYPESANPSITDKWKVCSSRPREDGAHCTERMLGMLTEAQARAIAAAPSVYDRANGLLAYYRDEDGCVQSDGTSETQDQAKFLKEQLVAAGWVEP